MPTLYFTLQNRSNIFTIYIIERRCELIPGGFSSFTGEVQDMIHFPVLKLQVYLPTVHTFHTLVSHMHPDVTITLNKLSGRHLSLSYSRVVKKFLLSASAIRSTRPWSNVQPGPR